MVVEATGWCRGDRASRRPPYAVPGGETWSFGTSGPAISRRPGPLWASSAASSDWSPRAQRRPRSSWSGVTPAIATAGIAASGTIGMFENLPGYLEIGELSEKSNIYATRSDGSVALLASFYDQNRVEVGWDAISQYVKDAAVAGEDPRFYEHGGIDLQGTVRAAVTTATGRETQGGSSIAQQYVKNVRVQECERMATDEEERDGLLRRGHRDEHRPQAQGDAPRDRRREALHEERDPARLPEHRRLRRHGVRHRGGGQLLLQHLGRQPLAGAGGVAHGDREQPREVPARQARQRDERRRERVRGRTPRGATTSSRAC